MKESRVWKYLLPHLPTYIEAERFEVLVPPGVSDVFWTDIRSSISGWLELKYCEPDDSEFLRGGIPKLKPEQPMFLRRQAAKNVRGGILLQVGVESWYLWVSRSKHEWIQGVRSSNAIRICDRHWKAPFDPVRLFEALGCPL